MPDKEHDDNLEEELRDLRPRIEYPPTPDVARAVRRRLDAEISQHSGPNIWSRMLSRPGWAAAAAVTILLSLIALSPAMRSTVSDSASSFGSGGAGGGGGAAGGVAEEDAASAGDPSAPSSEYAVEESASPGGQGASGGGASAAGTGMPPGGALGLGERLSTPEARARVGDLLVPGEVLGELAVGSEDYVCAENGVVLCAAGGASSEGDGVVLVFRPGRGLAPLGNTDVGLVLVETPGGMDGAYDVLARRASGAHPEEVVVGGGRGFWFPDGRLLSPQPGEVGSLPGGALLWERGDVALLMRADVTKEEAVRIAETVR